MFNCECCNYETDIKPNYTRHLKTKRHLEKSNISPTVVQQLSNSCPTIFKCNSCNKSYSSQSSLSKHHKKCVFVQITKLEEKLEENKKELE